ncbi:hypothetical protein OK18_04385 [Chryseobacterium gallinarum]|uniref:Uncharacterized protein n=1 Tax=Chryseobacterium gallinarum TaxID=1324352 RepID=A0A0G3LYE9_CHRGL|nr:hypothetical protein [Chryseobacterium gallinarum]AKK71976.1 hypothetical protein OK18_04385 [Chryseobacterium gallinarum]
MGIKFVIIIMLLFPLLIPSQINNGIKIFAKSKAPGMVNLDIINTTSDEKVIYIDTEAIHFACSKEDIWTNTFLRPNLCVELPEKYYTDELIGICQDCSGGYGFYGNIKLDNYIKPFKTKLKPHEKRQFSFNLQKTYHVEKKSKLFSLKSKIILYDFDKIGDSVRLKNPIESNTFFIQISLMRK